MAKRGRPSTKHWIKIEEFHAFEPTFYTQLETIILDNSQKTASHLRINPWQDWKVKRARPPYNTGWSVHMQRRGRGQKSLGRVFNRTNWQLTWLLEKGHIIVNKKGGVGWAAPHPHIKDAYDIHSKEYVRDVKEKLNITMELK